ncbi:putative G-protein coupled receptor CG31760 [Branchiostoma floridae x Branchiostoma japonicum]
MSGQIVLVSTALLLLQSASGATVSDGGDHRNRSSPDVDIVDRFLHYVEEVERNKHNCSAGTSLNLGEGVVLDYGRKRFRAQALVAVNRANFLTRLWKDNIPNIVDSEGFFFEAVRSMVEADGALFGAGNCYAEWEFRDHRLFCPYAHRTEDGMINVKDLSVEYDYTGEESEWFYEVRKNAMERSRGNVTIGLFTQRYNATAQGEPVEESSLLVSYEDGHWSLPYFDCGGGNIWMMTFTVPVFGFKDDSYFFKATSGIDIDLRQVDVNQCANMSGEERNVFANSHKCKRDTTKCVPISGLGFKVGSYRCECKKGFYFPDTTSATPYYNGTDVEQHYKRKKSGVTNDYDKSFSCLRCSPGCDECIDDRPCILEWDWTLRTGVLGAQLLIVGLIIPVLLTFTFKYADVKVLKAASPVLLRLVLLGAVLLYCPVLVAYSPPTVITCTLKSWFREVGFAVAYGALLLKTWRISVVFRVKSAAPVRITDQDLMKYLLGIVLIFAAHVAVRTIVDPPRVVTSRARGELKTVQCPSDWWDHSAAIGELLLLVWGIRLCWVVRKAPSEFNESKFITWAIYNETLLSVFLNIAMIFLQDPADPDVQYVLLFAHSQLTATMMLGLLFGSKVYMIYKCKRSQDLPQTGTTTTTQAKSTPASSASGKFLLTKKPGQQLQTPIEDWILADSQIPLNTELNSVTADNGPVTVEVEVEQIEKLLQNVKERCRSSQDKDDILRKVEAMLDAGGSAQEPSHINNGVQTTA